MISVFSIVLFVPESRGNQNLPEPRPESITIFSSEVSYRFSCGLKNLCSALNRAGHATG